jgi:hypothetical protein
MWKHHDPALTSICFLMQMNEHGEPMGSDGELPDELQESDSEVET